MLNVYRSVKKDTFLFYMNEISNYIIMEYFRKNVDQFDLDEGEIRILIQYYKCLFMGFLMEWLDNNLKSDFGEEMRQASRLFEKHPELHAVRIILLFPALTFTPDISYESVAVVIVPVKSTEALLRYGTLSDVIPK